MVQIHVNLCNTVQLLAGNLQCNGGKLEDLAEDFKCVFIIVVCYNQNRSVLVCELFSLFVGQLYQDKSLALRPHDLIFFTTQTSKQ